MIERERERERERDITMSDPAGAICGVPVKSKLFIVEHPVPTHAITGFIRSALVALIVVHTSLFGRPKLISVGSCVSIAVQLERLSTSV